MQEVKKYPVQPRVSLVNRVTHTAFSMDLCVTDPPRMTLTRNSGFAKYYMYAVDWNGFKNGKKGSGSIPIRLHASEMHSGRKLGRAVVSHYILTYMTCNETKAKLVHIIDRISHYNF